MSREKTSVFISYKIFKIKNYIYSCDESVNIRFNIDENILKLKLFNICICQTHPD